MQDLQDCTVSMWRPPAAGVCASTWSGPCCGRLLHHAVRVCACVPRSHFTSACCVAAACMLSCSCDECSVSWSTGACWEATPVLHQF